MEKEVRKFILQLIINSSRGDVNRHLDSLSDESKKLWIKSFPKLECKKNSVYLSIWDWIKFQERKTLLNNYFNGNKEV